MGSLIHRPYSSYISEETAMAKNQDEKCYTISPCFSSFHKEWMNCISNTSLMTQFIPKLSSQLSRPLNWTYNGQAWDFITHSVAVFFRLLSSPHCFSLCLDCSYMILQHHLPGWRRMDRGSRGFCQCCCQKIQMQVELQPQSDETAPTYGQFTHLDYHYTQPCY